MSAITPKYVLEGKEYEPKVLIENDEYFYEIRIEKGMGAELIKLPIDQVDFEVLKESKERYYFLFAVLYRTFQNKELDSPDSRVEEMINTILHHDEDYVSEFLWQQDNLKRFIISGFLNDWAGYKFLHSNGKFIRGDAKSWFGRI